MSEATSTAPAAADYQELTLAITDPVAIITLNRPAALNAFTSRMLAELRHAIAVAEADTRVVGIVLTGAGRGFCAGMDMNALNSMSQGDRSSEDLSTLAAHPGDPVAGEPFMLAFGYLLTVRKPIIAAINGACAGLGFVFALLCDMRFVAPEAKFTTAFAQRGLVAEHGSSWLLPRLIGAGHALDLLWSGRKFDGREAYSLRLAERLCEDQSPLDTAVAYLEALAEQSSPTSIRVMKAQVYRHLNGAFKDALSESNEWMDASLKREDFKEGVSSFMERRAPSFKRISND